MLAVLDDRSLTQIAAPIAAGRAGRSTGSGTWREKQGKKRWRLKDYHEIQSRRILYYPRVFSNRQINNLKLWKTKEGDSVRMQELTIGRDGLKPGLFLGEQIDRTLADGALDAGIGNIA
jgi:hypothetical protein